MCFDALEILSKREKTLIDDNENVIIKSEYRKIYYIISSNNS